MNNPSRFLEPSRCRARAVAISLALLAAPLPAQTPEERAIDSLFAGWTSSATPGCAVGAMRDGRLVFAKGYGMADIANRTPMSARSILGVASLSKQFTAAAVALLVQEGRLKASDDIRTYLPEIPAYPTPVLIRDLLHHTSGLRDYVSMAGLAGRSIEERIPREVVLELLGRQKKLNFPAGSAYTYSNTNYLLLSIIIERASGIPFATFMTERIFRPLGMTDSRFPRFAGDVVERQTESYRFDDSGRLSRAPLTDGFMGDGGAHMTLEDLARWEAQWLSPRIAPDGPAWVALMRSQPRFPDGQPVRYGWGTQFGTYRGVDIETHGGTWAGFRSYYLRLPSLGFASLVLCNQDETSPYQLTRRIADVFLATRFSEPSTPDDGPVFVQWSAPSRPAVQRIPEDQIRPFTGRFLSEELAVAYDIRHDSTRGVALQAAWTAPTTLRFVPPDTLAGRGFQLIARRGAEGRVIGYTMSSGRVRGIELTRIENPETVIVVPRSTTVTLDARLDTSEWTAAARARLGDGSEVMLQHDGRSLYVGIRAGKAGFPSACVTANDTTRILHASAALGTAVYVREDTTWALKKPFSWALRDRTFSDSTRQRQNAFADVQGWAGTTFHMSGTEKEMRIDLRLFDARNPRLAIGYFVANDGPVVPWPGSAAQDGCTDQRVVSGHLPAQVQFDNSTWAKLVFTM